MKWKIIGSRTAYADPFCKIRDDSVCLPNGKKTHYFVSEIRDWATVVAFTPKKQIVLTKQYRHPTKETLVELPAGKLEKGEKPLKGIQREFLEETGLELKKAQKMGCWFVSSGRSNCKVHVFIGKTTGNPKTQQLDEIEQITLLFKTPKQVMCMIQKEEIKSVPYIAAILAAKEKYPERFK